MNITLSRAQQQAVDQLKSWYKSPDKKPVFRIFGYAGSGKSTIVTYALTELGIGPHECGGETGFLAATFTGKAALVMTRKGTPASTIHSLIYRVSEATKAEIDKLKKDIAEIKAKLPNLGPGERMPEESRLWSLELRLADIHKPKFVLNEDSIVRDAKLIVLDEVSMVGEEMARDLLAFGKPILVLGDPGQLPPIKGDGAFTRAPPDVMLTEIHRQAGESAIIRLATMARQGQPIPHGEHDAHVWKMPRTRS